MRVCQNISVNMGENRRRFVVGIDLGAGFGAKLGLFDDTLDLVCTGTLSISGIGRNPDALVSGLCDKIDEMLTKDGLARQDIAALGLASAGLFRSDGSFLSAINLPFLKDANLKELLAERLNIPVGCINDADAGALAEWNIRRVELLYWVFGGGWGGAWVSSDGQIRYSSIDWNGDDTSLHYTNEPGYAIPIGKKLLHDLFERMGICFERFEKICVGELKTPGATLTGPAGRTDCVRAELLLSGPGRWRIFCTFAASDHSFESHLSLEEISDLNDSVTAGVVIDKLGKLKADVAVRTDRLFGQILAEATFILIRQAIADGCHAGIPIYIAGRPSRALPFFGPAAEDTMRAKGIMNRLHLSALESEGRNANLVGVAMLARGML